MVNSLTDKQLTLLYNRLNENEKGSVKVKKEIDPNVIKKYIDSGTNVEIMEKDLDVEIDKEDDLKEETKKWIISLINEKYSLTTKGQIMEMVKKRMSTVVEPITKPTTKPTTPTHPLKPNKDITTKPKAIK